MNDARVHRHPVNRRVDGGHEADDIESSSIRVACRASALSLPLDQLIHAFDDGRRRHCVDRPSREVTVVRATKMTHTPTVMARGAFIPRHPSVE